MAVIKWARAASYNKANTYPGANGEIVIDIEQNRLFLYDGANAYVSNTFFQSNVYISSGAASFDWTNTPTESVIRPSDGQASDMFGYVCRLSKDGQYAIVGSTYEDGGSGDPTSGAGAAYIFLRSGSSWAQQAKLTASDAEANDAFGIDVSISENGDYAVVGSQYGGTGSGNDNHGSAYVFVRSGTSWSQQAELTASDAYEGAQFGYNVDINADGTYIAISAPVDQSTNLGAVYVFTRSGSTWSQQQKLTASNAGSQDKLGYSCRISDDGDYIIACAPYEDTTASDVGMAYIFSRSGSTWSQQANFQHSDAQLEDRLGFGADISGDGNYAIFGSTWEDGGSGDPIDRAGAAYVFLRTGTSWAQQAKLTASDAGSTDSFGYQVSISTDGTYALVGTAYNYPATAYLYKRTGTSWSEVKKFTEGTSGLSGDKFGYAVDLSGDGQFAIVTAISDNDNGSDSGAAYIYEAT